MFSLKMNMLEWMCVRYKLTIFGDKFKLIWCSFEIIFKYKSKLKNFKNFWVKIQPYKKSSKLLAQLILHYWLLLPKHVKISQHFLSLFVASINYWTRIYEIEIDFLYYGQRIISPINSDSVCVPTCITLEHSLTNFRFLLFPLVLISAFYDIDDWGRKHPPQSILNYSG